MGLFKNTDERLKEIGFNKIEEGTKFTSYSRNIEQYGYTQRLDFLYKNSGRHLVQSYQEGCNSDGYSNVVGLTRKELKLCVRKMKELGLK